MASEYINLRQASVVLELLFVKASQKADTRELLIELRSMVGSVDDPAALEAMNKVIEAVSDIHDRDSGSTMKAAMVEQYFANAAKILSISRLP